MGFNCASCGYGSAAEMVDAFASDERWQVLGFADFCRTRKLIDAIQHQDWSGFGKLYNGDGAVYGPKIKAAYDLKERLLKLPRVPGDGVAPGLASSGLPSPNVVQLETALEAIA